MMRVSTHTQTWREELSVEIGDEFLILCIEEAGPCNDIAWQAHAHDLKHRFEDEQGQMHKVRVLAVRRQVLSEGR